MPLILSVLIHLLLILTLGLKPSSPLPPSQGQVSVTLLSPGEGERYKERGSVHAGEKECTGKFSYGGIGVLTNLNNVVINAPSIYPGYRVGLREGDVLDESEENMQGKPGSEVTIHWIRQGKRMTATTIREHICAERTHV
jgi:hypothetical protein